jgi:hypothetical protein
VAGGVGPVVAKVVLEFLPFRTTKDKPTAAANTAMIITNGRNFFISIKNEIKNELRRAASLESANF